LGSFKIIDSGTIQMLGYDFLFTFHGNYEKLEWCGYPTLKKIERYV